jgi:release factor glutamine methyltransferase
MTIENAQKKIINAVQHIYDKGESGNIAELLLEYITKLSRIEIIIKKNENLSTSQVEFLNQAIERLQTHEPVQYVTHEAWFAGMKFYVERNVLIPRPETEELVDWISKDAGNKNPGIKILDIGTGSGCIAIALKKSLPASEVWACDMSEEALNIARINADSLHAAIDFVPVDFLDEKQTPQLRKDRKPK